MKIIKINLYLFCLSLTAGISEVHFYFTGTSGWDLTFETPFFFFTEIMYVLVTVIFSKTAFHLQNGKAQCRMLAVWMLRSPCSGCPFSSDVYVTDKELSF